MMETEKIDFHEFTSNQLKEAFEVLVYSIDHVRPWGFDVVNGEGIAELYAELSPYHKSQVKQAIGIEDKRLTAKSFEAYFYENTEQRLDMWREVYLRLSDFDKAYFLENNRSFYEKAHELMGNQFDWSTFTCALEVEGEASKIKMVTTHWNELSTQVYGCLTSHNGAMCPCLRAANDTTGYKCFRTYLENKESRPDGQVPSRMLTAMRR